MQKIKNVSLFFRLLFQVCFLIYPIILIIFWLKAPSAFMIGNHTAGFGMNFIPRDTVILEPLLPITKFYGFLVTLIPTAVVEITLYFLIKLFRLYEQGNFFALQNVKYIKYIGYSILAGQILNPFHHALLTAILTWHNPVGERYAIFTLSGMNIALILMSLLIILVSWIMAEGAKLQEEQQYII